MIERIWQTTYDDYYASIENVMGSEEWFRINLIVQLKELNFNLRAIND